MSPAPSPFSSSPDPGPGELSRRSFLTAVAAGTAGLALFGWVPRAAAVRLRFVEDAYAGLAAFVLPGDDAYSRQQRETHPGPGGVAAGAGLVVRDTLDMAIPLQLGKTPLPAPGALGYAIILQSLALGAVPRSGQGPFANAFANLTWARKRQVLDRLDDLPALSGSIIGYSGNALSTLAGLGAYSEASAFDRRTFQLTGRPVGWDVSHYGGVSDGWPDLIGYLEGRTEVTA